MSVYTTHIPLPRLLVATLRLRVRSAAKRPTERGRRSKSAERGRGF